MYFFFFKQKTAYEMRISDWSSDVCSSDLNLGTDAAVLDALIAKRNADRAREEEVAASAAEAAAREQDQKMIDARHRDERRRAKARKRAWERQLRDRKSVV